MSITPLLLSLTTTRLGTVCPATQLRSEVPGSGVPPGTTSRKLGAVVSVTVTFSTTALGGTGSVILGTPPWPAIVSDIVLVGPSGGCFNGP